MDARFDAERELLEAANRHVAEAEERIVLQRRRIEELMSAGAVTKDSEALLALMQEGLLAMQRHRQQILHALAEFKRMRRSALR